MPGLSRLQLDQVHGNVGKINKRFPGVQPACCWALLPFSRLIVHDLIDNIPGNIVDYETDGLFLV